MPEIIPEFDIDAAIAQDIPGTPQITTTSQLQKQIDLCSSGQITIEAFYMSVVFDLGLMTSEAWDYLQQNNGTPSPEMIQKLLGTIAGWKVVDISKLTP
jgi:hypothetical protein